MRLIEISRGMSTKVDDWNYEYLNKWKWSPVLKDLKWYAMRKNGNATVYMHRVIMNTPNNLEVDHKNGDGLDNQEHNMRNCTRTQNSQNNCLRCDSTTGYKGVQWRSDSSNYRVRIIVNGLAVCLGSFKTPEEAAIIYDAAATYYFGEFAKLNFPSNTSMYTKLIEDKRQQDMKGLPSCA